MQENSATIKRRSGTDQDKQAFLVADESTPSGVKYLNILLGSLETPHVNYLYDCQPQPMCAK